MLAEISSTLPAGSAPAIPVAAMVLRLGLAALMGAIIGYERELRGRAAGLRTTMLACMAACVASILSESLYHDAGDGAPPGSWHPDPARLAQGVLAGMGFLGAGVVVREGKIIRGVTTAAVLWFVTIIGLTIGAGHYQLGILGWCCAMLALVVMPLIERYVPSDWYGSVSVTVRNNGATDAQIREAIVAAGVSIKDTNYDIDVETAQRTVKIAIKYNRGNLLSLSDSVKENVLRLHGVTRVQWHAAT